MVVLVVVASAKLIGWGTVVRLREHGTVEPLSVMEEETPQLSIRIKETLHHVIVRIRQLGLVILVTLPQTQPYRAQEQEGITRASMVVRVWMA